MCRSVFAVPSLPRNACLLLDFDGTLVDFASEPASIQVSADLVPLLANLHQRLDGALAMVTGRSLHDLDGYLAPLRLPVAALHGTVRRDGRGKTVADLAAITHFATASRGIRERFRHWVDQHPGLLLEDKGYALALHFRRAQPPWRPDATLLATVQSLLTPGLEVLRGDQVIEVRPRGSDKGTAVAAFLAEPPFNGRVPVYLGDDLADLPALAAVERLGGLGIAVGNRVEASWRLPDPAAARAWLAGTLSSLEVP